MKKIALLVLIAVLWFATGYSQQYPVSQYLGATNTLVITRGGLKVDSSFILPAFGDTANANISPYIKNYPGALIRVLDVIYMRNYNATQWIAIQGGGGGNPWNLTGNANATAGSSFLGTTNYIPLEFRVNNKKSGYLDSTYKTTSLGYGSLRDLTPSGTTTGNHNVSIGYKSMNKDTTGYQNTSLGSQSLLNSSGSIGNVSLGYGAMGLSRKVNYNVAMGWGALSKNYYGYYNTAIGHNSAGNLVPAAGDTMIYNTFLGAFSGYNQRAGRNNVMIGDSAGLNNQSGSRNVFIGSRAGTNETGSDKLYISNSNTSSPLIKGDFVTEKVNMNGKLLIGGMNPADSTLDVKGGVKLQQLFSSNNASDSMLVVKTNGGVGLRAVPIINPNNGLSLNASNNIQLGGTLIKSTTIDGSTYDYTMSWLDANSDSYGFKRKTNKIQIGSFDGGICLGEFRPIDSTISFDAKEIELIQTNTSSDTNTYKPLGIDNLGTISKMNNWPSGGGTTPTLQEVTTAGATTDQTITMTGYGGIFNQEYNRYNLVNSLVNFYPFYSQYPTLGQTAYIQLSESGQSVAGNEYEYFNGITTGDHVKINPNVYETSGGGGGFVVQIIPTYADNDVHYLPISDAITDTLATLADVRNGGGGSTPSLQAVTDVGNNTTNDIKLSNLSGDTTTIFPNGIKSESIGNYKFTINRNPFSSNEFIDFNSFNGIAYDTIQIFTNKINVRNGYSGSGFIINNDGINFKTDSDNYFGINTSQYYNINPSGGEIRITNNTNNSKINLIAQDPFVFSGGYDIHLPVSTNYIGPDYQPDTLATLADVRSGGGGSGTVTSISQGYGIVNSPNPIVATGTITVDTATLSTKYVRISDNDTVYTTSPIMTTVSGDSTIVYFNADTANVWRNQIDSLKRNVGTDSVFARKNGQWNFQYKDSVGTNPPASGYYGAFQDNTTQSAVSANTAYPVQLNTTDLTNGVSVVNDGSGNPTRVTLANTGIYNIQFSLQLEKTGGSGNFIVDIWVRKNGVDIPATTGKIVLTGSANASPVVAAWNYVLDLTAGDYVQLMWSTSNNNAVILASAAAAPHPSVPSAILTVTQQSGIMAGTGITAINSLTGSAQTLVTGTDSTDFRIVSSGTTHKFNLPTASATNTGKLSNSDWSTFNSKIGASDTSVFQRKNIAANSFMANNTNAAANVTNQTYIDNGDQNISGTITVGGTTAPTSLTSATYQWQQVGKTVTFTANILYGTAGSANTSLNFPLPSDMPAPHVPTGWSGANGYAYTGIISTHGSPILSASATGVSSIRRNSGNTGWDIQCAFASTAVRGMKITLTYRVP